MPVGGNFKPKAVLIQQLISYEKVVFIIPSINHSNHHFFYAG